MRPRSGAGGEPTRGVTITTVTVEIEIPARGGQRLSAAAVSDRARGQPTARSGCSHAPRNRSLSAAGSTTPTAYIAVPGRTLESLMAELGGDHIDLLKLDIERSEYEVVPTLKLRPLGVRLFAAQLHHTASVRAAGSLIELARPRATSRWRSGRC
jgi:Methyltransferase FkbM domain